MKNKNSSDYKSVILWLGFTAFMVFAMAVIGAITRLTESGLSMVEWRPLIGALPPLNEAEWNRVFDLYKKIPEYQLVHSWMGLEDFKRIFFWEWFHRLWGRLIGLVYALPLFYFWAKGMIPAGFKPRFIGLLVLGGLQGVMGWYMVMSGLEIRVDVSHYRLAAHLSLAFIIFGLLVWTLLDIKNGKRQWSTENFCLKRHGLVSLFLLFITLIWGAFVAGTNGGLVYNTWPLMGDSFIPQEVLRLMNLINEPAAIQFVHRWLAMFTGVVIIGFAWRVRDVKLGAMMGIQIVLGISTLLLGVPIWLAALHQAGAFILLALMLLSVHRVFERKLLLSA